MLSDERLAEIKARTDKATPGPWRWQEGRFREKYMQQMKNGNWRARIGKRAKDSWVMLLTGPLRWKAYADEEENFNVVDEWDYDHILSLRWSQVRGNSLFNATPKQEDCDFMAAARTDVDDLLADAEEARQIIASLKARLAEQDARA